jgi:hypothetical protein
MRTLSRPLTARSHNEPFFYMHGIPGGRVITQQTGPNEWVTCIQGGRLDGQRSWWQEAVCAIDGHFRALQLARHSHLMQADRTL